MTDWLDILKKQVEATSCAAVGRKIGYSRVTVSHLVHGRYPGKPDKVAAAILKAFADQITCPHLNDTISPEDCDGIRNGPMPTSNPARLRHWSACQMCPRNQNKAGQAA